jgi:AcrR family transcriptional regulator
MVTSDALSRLGENRQGGKHQVASRRDSILDAAEKLFLRDGLENTAMIDIAREAGITKVTLYRYFPDRDPIAFEIAIRMLKRIAASFEQPGQDITPEWLKQFALAMIENFYSLRDAYRYIGMFDHLYGSHYPNETLAAWYKDQMLSFKWGGRSFTDAQPDFRRRSLVVVVLNTVMSFLEKMAGRGDLMSAEQGIPLDVQLSVFKEIIGGFIDRLVETTADQ